MWFLYTGEVENPRLSELTFVVDLLRLSDSFLVDEVKVECEKLL
jgi:hypothetical protein